MVYGYKWDIVIIDLSLTIYSIKSAFVLVCLCATKVSLFDLLHKIKHLIGILVI